MKHLLLAAAAATLSLGSALAAPITHDADDSVGVAVTPAFGALVDAVDDAFIGSGADYTWGATEGIFQDGSQRALCGINAAGICDLVTSVDARIVLAGTTTQGLTSTITVEAGVAAAGALTLEVFDIGGNLIASALNGSPQGPNGRQTMTVDRGGIFDIAFFRVSGLDSFGVNWVQMENPIAGGAPVPVPAAALLFPLGAAFIARRRAR
ncbi:MAG: hypothetical protein AAGH41_00170 [Pseudomonadota bacterium]